MWIIFHIIFCPANTVEELAKSVMPVYCLTQLSNLHFSSKSAAVQLQDLEV